jgi:N-acetylglucosamine-6-phosphate deacetylase
MKLIAAHYRTGETFEFTLAGRRLVSKRRVRAKADALFGPGFVDLQCNGFGGVDFNHPDDTGEVCASAIRAMWEAGVAHVFPTLITASREWLRENIEQLNEALSSDPDVRRSVPGYHLEGPFISPVDGARGAHPAEDVSPISTKLWRDLQRFTEGKIRIVTLAPELRGACAFIAQLRKENVLPALGHTLAIHAQIAAAYDAGALMSTHLGNGCPQTMHRHINPIFAQLGEPRLAASLIADGAHLPPEVLRALSAALGARAVLVTDAMSAAGAPPGKYSIGKLVIEVGSDGIVRQPGSPNLAGSSLTMNSAVANYTRLAGVPLADAWDCASLRPWALLKKAGVVKTASPASTVIATENLDIVATMHGSRVLWTRHTDAR